MSNKYDGIKYNYSYVHFDNQDQERDPDLIGLWICIGVVAVILMFLVILISLRFYFRGPLKGSNNPARLDDRTVVITGKFS